MDQIVIMGGARNLCGTFPGFGFLVSQCTPVLVTQSTLALVTQSIRAWTVPSCRLPTLWPVKETQTSLVDAQQGREHL